MKMHKTALFATVLAAGSASAAVPTPWTPVEAKDGVVSVWRREYAFASNALHGKKESLSVERLAGGDAAVMIPALSAWNCGWLDLTEVE